MSVKASHNKRYRVEKRSFNCFATFSFQPYVNALASPTSCVVA